MAPIISRTHIWVKGRVQNVGFRAYVARCASELGIVGWVRNISWDTVETVAEGTPAQIDLFIQAVKSGPSSSSVEESVVETETPTSEFVTFSVRTSK